MAMKRKGEPVGLIQDQDPDYETVSVMTASKRQRLFEKDAKDITVKKIEGIIKRQFAIEMKHKEKEVELIDERIHQTRAMLDKLRACIVANYYGNIGLTHSSTKGEKSRSLKVNLNHPAIQRALNNRLKSSTSETADPTPAEPPGAPMGRSRTPAGGGAVEVAVSTPSSGHWSSLQSERSSPESEQLSRADLAEVEEEARGGGGAKGPRNSGPDTFGVGPPLLIPKIPVSQVESDEGSRFHVKKRIIVGNVSKYIPPENREDSDPSTHKWMVYVRGPPEEPRIDHFVKRIWFFLHPSYRPNDLVEVKEPPFHLTRRGWGEFPIRIQLHFLDPRNKKVDIIHPLKLDRTYTGLQTLGAETIVDVELDRYLFDDHGLPLSRPMTPTITKVNYQEGIKPGSPGTSWDEARWKGASPRIKDSGKGAATGDRFQEEQGVSDGTVIPRTEVSEESPMQVTAASDEISPKAEPQGDPSEVVVPSEPGQSFSGIIGPTGIQPSSQGNAIGSASTGQIAVQQRQGGQFVRVMPPLGPITKSAVITPSTLSGLSQKGQMPAASPAKVVTPTEDRTGSIIGSPSSSQTSSANVSPTLTGGINVADAAFTGKGTLDVRIQEGKVIQEVVSPSQDVVQIKTEATTSVTAMPPGILPLVQQAPLKSPPVLQATTPSRVQNVQGVLVTSGLQKLPQVVGGSVLGTLSQAGGIVVQPTSSQLNKPVMSTVPSGASGVIPAVKRIPSSGSITVIPSRTSAEATKHSPPVSASGIPSAPPGTQYYITAKSTDPNLQGKVILIPQQVFQQASNQQAVASGKQGAGKASSPGGKAGTSKVVASSKSPFLSPSNVLILPAGSIVPPLPPGSIVQIQQVPSPVRSTSASNQPKSHSTSALTKAIAAPGKSTGAKATGLPSGGVIQIQRTSGTSIAKVSGVQGGVSQAAGISILPEHKGQLAKTPSGGVVFVQRAPSAGKIASGQTLTRLPLVQGGLALPQKITLAAQLPPGAVPLPQGSLTLKPGSSVNIIQNPTPKSLHQGQTLVLHAQPSSIPKIQGKHLQGVTAIRQPVVPGQTSKFIIQGQGSKLMAPGQLQVRLNTAPATGVTAARPITATAVGTSIAEPNPVMIAQGPNEAKVGHGAAVLMAQGSAPKTTDAGIQVLEEPGTAEKEAESVSSPVPKELSKTATPSADDGSQGIIISEQIKASSSSQKAIMPESSNRADIVAPLSEIPPKLVSPVIPHQPLSKVVIKQEPITSPQKTLPPMPIIQRIVHPTPATTAIQMEAGTAKEEEEDEGSEVSTLMRELTMSCMEGPVSVYGLKTIEELITAVVKKTPLINKDRVQSEHPFSATSLQHFHSWSGAKRRAAEWHRAVSVRRIANEAREKSERLRFERMWTTKEVMVWCRQRGYTPPEPDQGLIEKVECWCDICGDLQVKEKEMAPIGQDGHNCRNHWLSTNGLLKATTYTVPDDVADTMQEQQAAMNKSFADSDAEIDVIGVWNPGHRTRIKKEPSRAQEGIRCYLPLSEGAKLAQAVSQQIGVSFKPVQLAPDTFASVAEEVMFSAASQFLNTLLRESLAKAYKGRSDNRLPKEILPTHVLQAINGIESCDFLSNRHMGVLSMPAEESQP